MSSIITAINKFYSNAQEIYVCGGGSKNKFMLERLAILSKLKVHKTDELDISAQKVESLAFAWLANKSLNKEYNNSPSVTGSKGPRILGTIHFS